MRSIKEQIVDSLEGKREGYCNECDKFIEDLNGNEEEELIREGSFVCSTCINEEMNYEVIDF